MGLLGRTASACPLWAASRPSPGHAAAWCVGYPELCPLDKGPNSPGCGAPLDVSKNSTFELVDGLVGELHEIFPVSTA